MKTKLSIVLLAVFVLGSVGFCYAAEGNSISRAINEQYDRIEKGLKRGYLTGEEADMVRNRLDKVRADFEARKRATNGNISHNDLIRLNHEVNEIHKYIHNKFLNHGKRSDERKK